MEKSYFVVLWSWRDPTELRPGFSLLRHWALGALGWHEEEKRHNSLEDHPLRSDKTFISVETSLLCLVPDAFGLSSFSPSLWSLWIPTTIAAMLFSLLMPQSLLTSECWLIQLEKSKYQERKHRRVCFYLAYLSRERISALSNVW